MMIFRTVNQFTASRYHTLHNYSEAHVSLPTLIGMKQSAVSYEL